MVLSNEAPVRGRCAVSQQRAHGPHGVLWLWLWLWVGEGVPRKKLAESQEAFPSTHANKPYYPEVGAKVPK